MFSGEDVTDTLALVLTKEPQWSLLPPKRPPRFGASSAAAWSGTATAGSPTSETRGSTSMGLRATRPTDRGASTSPSRALRLGRWLLWLGGARGAPALGLVILQLRAGSSSAAAPSPRPRASPSD